jgi:isopropylmalate/homocitrate/citramalate synthase
MSLRTNAEIPGQMSAPSYVAGHHWFSPFNFAQPVQADLSFVEPMVIVDSTLRKIITTTGVRPSIRRMVDIAAALEEAGVREMILNLYWFGEPVPSPVESALVSAILGAGLSVNITVSCDALIGGGSYGKEAHTIPASEVLEKVQSLGAKAIAIEGMGPRSETPTQRDTRLERVNGVFKEAHERGMRCALHLGDPGRREFADVVEMANQGLGMGAVRLDISDSFGSLSPEGMKFFIRSLIANVARRVPVTVHCHNDLGLATATALAATTAGALPDVSVNGLSYRAGFAALEEVVVALEMLYGIRSGIRLERLQLLSDLVAESVGFPRNPMKAVTGEHARLRNRPRWMIDYLEGTFPPSAACFVPALTGSQLGMVWDNNPSNAVIRTKLHQMGLEIGEDKVEEIRSRIDRLLETKSSYPYWLDESEIESICHAVAG